MNEERGVDLPDGHVHYRMLGESGPPVVLLHGGGLDNSHWTWRWVAPDLASDHQVFAPDHPKHGKSWPWRARADQHNQEVTLERLMDIWGLESATFIGLSLGSATALGFALRNPQRVNRLVLTACGGIQDRVAAHELAYLSLRTPVSWLMTRSQTASALDRWVRKHVRFDHGTSPEDIDALGRNAAAEFRTKRQHGGHMFSDWNRFEIAPRRMRVDFRNQLSEVSCPMLFVHGSVDPAVPLKYPREAAEKARNGRMEVIEGAGHFVPVERPSEYIAVVRNFLHEES